MAETNKAKENQKFRSLLAKYKKKGYTKQQAIMEIEKALLMGKMESMLTPNNKSIKEDLKRVKRLKKYINRNWKRGLDELT